ncbi:MAG: hypothetical protein Q4B85_06950 [Lachnospiraceae bacterium]|nr:hypothetical protein [Lachnospiraceae bacterium]
MKVKVVHEVLFSPAGTTAVVADLMTNTLTDQEFLSHRRMLEKSFVERKKPSFLL